MKPMRVCMLITMGRPVVKESGKQLKRDDSYRLWKQVLGFSFNSYHLLHLNQYSQAWGPINIIKEWKPPRMNVQIQARKCFQSIMVPFTSLLPAVWLSWLSPEQPFLLQLWVQERDFINPEQKAQGGSGFGNHTSKGKGDPTHTFSQWSVEKGERGSHKKPCWGERLLRQWLEKQMEMSNMHWELMEWPVAWSWALAHS